VILLFWLELATSLIRNSDISYLELAISLLWISDIVNSEYNNSSSRLAILLLALENC